MNAVEKRMELCCLCAMVASLCTLALNKPLHGQCQLNEDLKVMPSDTTNARSGRSVAVHGETAIVGSPGADGEGSATVYSFNGTSWVADATLSPSGLDTGDGFGHAVAIYDDLIAVSANGDDDGATNGGAVYIFRKSSSWTEEVKIVPSSVHAQSVIGTSLDFSDDGERVIIGAPLFHANSKTDSGAAFIYRHQIDGNGDDEWVEEAMVTAGSLAHDFAGFGESVTMTDYTAVVGAWQHHQPSGIPGQPAFQDVGQAYVFRRSSTTWTDDQEIRPPHEEIEFANFGRSVALQTDDQGDTLIIGAMQDDARIIVEGPDGEEEVPVLGTGAVYVYYEKYVNGSYKFETTNPKQIHAPVPMDNDLFGISVSLDGDTLLVGAAGDVDACGGVRIPSVCNAAGIAYIYERDLGGVGNWGFLSTVNASDTANFDWFGYSVGVSGNRAIVGARYEDRACNTTCSIMPCGNMEPTNCNSGAAYFFWTITDPDICDCNGNTIPDWIDVEQETSIDCDGNGAPDECDCRADVYDCDKEVNVDDVFELIDAWGDCPTDDPCREDIGPGLLGDGKVDQHDLNVLLRNWGTCGLPAGSVQVDQVVQDCIDDCSMSDPDCLYDCLNGN